MSFEQTANRTDLLKKIQECGSLTVAERKVLAGLARQTVIKIQEADTAALDSATPADSTYLQVPLKGGRRYKVKVVAQMTNATAADGCELSLVLTGTQTSAVSQGLTIMTDYTATVFAALALSSGVQRFNDADSGDVSFLIDGYIQPQNDGILKVQYAEHADGGATGAVLKKGSRLEVTELEQSFVVS